LLVASQASRQTRWHARDINQAAVKSIGGSQGHVFLAAPCEYAGWNPLWVEHDLSQLNVYGEPCLLVLKLCGASVYKRFVFTTFLY
jgi:hypothetical protein